MVVESLHESVRRNAPVLLILGSGLSVTLVLFELSLHADTESISGIYSSLERMDGWVVLIAGLLVTGIATQFARMSLQQTIAKTLKKYLEFTLMLTASQPGFFLLFDELGHIIRWSKNLADLTGLSSDRFLGSDAFGFVVESDR